MNEGFHLFPEQASTFAWQVEVMANCPAALIEEIFSALAPVLVSVTFSGALVVPTACFLKFNGVVGERLTTPVFSSTITSLCWWSGTAMSFSGLSIHLDSIHRFHP